MRRFFTSAFGLSALLAVSLLGAMPAPARAEKYSDNLMRHWIVSYGVRHLNVVIAPGQCTDLVDSALHAVRAKPKVIRNAGTPEETYEWGTYKRASRRYFAGRKIFTLEAGDVIQFKSAVFKNNGYTWNMGFPRHTAIVKSASPSGRVVLLHQNAPAGSGVSELTLDLRWLVSGTYSVYAPVPK